MSSLTDEIFSQMSGAAMQQIGQQLQRRRRVIDHQNFIGPPGRTRCCDARCRIHRSAPPRKLARNGET